MRVWHNQNYLPWLCYLPYSIEIDPEKGSAVKNYETPTCVRDLQCFLVFANFYRHFIKGYSRICQPMVNLLKSTILFIGYSNVNRYLMNLKNDSVLPQSWSTSTPPLKPYWKPMPPIILFPESCLRNTFRMANLSYILLPFCPKKCPLPSVIMEL